MKRMFNCLGFLLTIVVIFTLVYFINSARESSTAATTKKANTFLQTSLYQLLDSLQRNPDLANVLQGKYIETEGALLTMGAEDGGGTYLYFTATQQTDTSFEIAHALDYKTIQQKATWTACDSAIVAYQKVFRLHETAAKLTAIASVVNPLTSNEEQVMYFKQCPPYTNASKKIEYQLQNFCYETVRVKALVSAIRKTEDGYRVELEAGLLLSKTPLEKR